MDSMSITTGCSTLSNSISKTSGAIRAFVREIRESRSELDAISGELYSLDGVLDLLKDDAASFPPTLAHRTPVLLDRCAAIVNELGGYISTINASGLSKHDKKFRWIATRKHMAKLGGTLEVHKATLGLALDMVSLGSPRNSRVLSGKDDASNVVTNDRDSAASVSRIVAEMNRLTARLTRESQGNGATFSLQNYLDAVQAYGASLGIKFEADDGDGHASSVGDGPDSAIEMSDEVVFPTLPDMIPHDVSLSVEEIDELLDELKDTMPSRPPTPPPKARARANSTRSSVVSPIDHRLNTPDSEDSPGNRSNVVDMSPKVPGRSSSLRDASVAPSESDNRTVDSLYTVVTRASSDDQSVAPIRDNRAARLFGHVRNALSTASERTAAEPPPPIARHPPGLVRRGSRRLSFTLKSLPNLPKWKAESAAEEENPEPDTIFGVSLKKSIQIAKGTVKTRHTGSGSSSREFPLCVYKCYSFIKEEGIEAQDIFGEGGDPELLQRLKDVFSTGPGYGHEIDWSGFGVYEAADLILLFLAQLPKPIVSETVAKRWISLSKQATMPGSHAIRLEQCIDFWEEALGGVRGPARSLFKLLLNLWGDIADAAEKNDMTAERLAARVLNPLMHLPAGKYDTDYMLGLAFLIRKRSEYSMMLQGDTRKSNAAF